MYDKLKKEQGGHIILIDCCLRPVCMIFVAQIAFHNGMPTHKHLPYKVSHVVS